MLQFNTIQPLFPKENVNLLCPHVSITNMIPFQFHSPIIGNVTGIYLINNTETIDITSKITIKKYRTSLTSDGAWYVHFLTAVNDLRCGTYQLKIVINNGISTTNYYSNFFKIIDTTDYSYINITNTKDILGKLYNSINYFDRIYFKNYQIKQIEPFIFEETSENGDGTKTIIYQNFAKQYEVKFICDKYAMDLFSQLYLFDTVTITYENYSTTYIFENITTDISFNDDIDLYEVILNFKIGNLDKNICETNFVVNEFTTLGGGSSINGTDKLLINVTDKLLIN